MKQSLEDLLSNLLTSVYAFFGKLLAVYAGLIACSFVLFHSIEIVKNEFSLFFIPSYIAIFVSLSLAILLVLAILACIQMFLRDVRKFVNFSNWSEGILFFLIGNFALIFLLFQIIFLFRETTS